MHANTTYYRDTAHSRVYPAVSGRHGVKVCVVGAGFAGLNTALGLVERGVRDVLVLDAQSPGFGASGRNGGFVFAGFSLGEDRLLADLGPARAKALYRGTTDAVALIRKRVDQYAIDCAAVDGGVLWVNWFRDRKVLATRQRLLAEHFDSHWQWLSAAQVQQRVRSARYHDALFEPAALHLHPLNYALGIADAAMRQGARIHGDSPALALARHGSGWRITTPDAQIDAEQVVLACGGYLAGLLRRVDEAVLPIATYVMVTEPLGARMAEVLSTQAAVYDTRFAFDYYRPLPDTRLLWGGRISVLDRSPQAVRRVLCRDLLKVFPQLAGVGIDYAWSGLMSYASHEMPQIGEIEPGLWLAQAFGGHGVAPTTFAGELVAAAIAEGDSRWRELDHYGLVSAFKPAGFVGAQLGYSWLQVRDAYKDWCERIV